MTVPDGWHEAALGDVCTVVSGATPKTGMPEYWGGKIRWITPNDLSKDRSQTVFAGERAFTQAGYDSCSARLFPAGSVIVSTRAPVGYVAIAGNDMCTNQGCKTAIPPPFLDSKYLYWYLVAAKPDLEARASGTTFKEISGKRFAETRLRWPGIEEQRRIVAVLEDHLSRLDAADRTLEAAPRRTVGLQESWLARRLTPVAEEVTTIGATLRDVRGGWSRSRQHLVSSDEGVPYLKMNNITRRGGLDLSDLVFVAATDDIRAKYAVEPGDVLFNSKNSGDLIGKTTLADARIAGAVINENIMRLRFDDRVEPAFAALWFMGPTMRGRILTAASASTNVAAVYQKDLVRFPMWIPDKGRQRQLVAEFVQIRQDGEVLDAATSRAVARSRGLRRSLLAAAFAGSLTGRATDDSSDAEEMIGA